MNALAVTILRALLAAMFALLLVAQTVALPTTAGRWASAYPELDWLRVPGLIIAVGFIVCVQIVLVCLWRVLGLAGEDGPFSADSLRYFSVIIGAIVVADALIIAALVLLAMGNAANPSIMLLGSFGVVVGAALALLVGVMRALLRTALAFQHDLSEVV